MVTVRIENWYSDGHESKSEALVEPPEATAHVSAAFRLAVCGFGRRV